MDQRSLGRDATMDNKRLKCKKLLVIHSINLIDHRINEQCDYCLSLGMIDLGSSCAKHESSAHDFYDELNRWKRHLRANMIVNKYMLLLVEHLSREVALLQQQQQQQTTERSMQPKKHDDTSLLQLLFPSGCSAVHRALSRIAHFLFGEKSMIGEMEIDEGSIKPQTGYPGNSSDNDHNGAELIVVANEDDAEKPEEKDNEEPGTNGAIKRKYLQVDYNKVQLYNPSTPVPQVSDGEITDQRHEGMTAGARVAVVDDSDNSKHVRRHPTIIKYYYPMVTVWNAREVSEALCHPRRALLRRLLYVALCGDVENVSPQELFLVTFAFRRLCHWVKASL